MFLSRASAFLSVFFENVTSSREKGSKRWAEESGTDHNRSMDTYVGILNTYDTLKRIKRIRLYHDASHIPSNVRFIYIFIIIQLPNLLLVRICQVYKR